MSTFAWILLALAIVDIVFTIGQLFVLRGMKIIVHEMSLGQAWAWVVGPPVVVLLLAIAALNDNDIGLLWLLIGWGVFIVSVILQSVAMVPILERRREWDAQNKVRDFVKGQR